MNIDRIDAREVPRGAGFEAGALPPEVLQLGVRALLGVVGEPSAAVRQLIEALIELWRETGGQGEVAIENPSPLDPAQIALRFVEGPLRVQLIRVCAAAILLDRQRDLGRINRLELLAAELGVDEPALGDLRRWVRHQHLRLRRNLIPRLWAADELRLRASEEGWAKVMWVAFSALILGIRENAEVLAHYRPLAALPSDTLGGALVSQLHGSGFALPGERGSPDDWMVRHDIVHVLAGLGTDPRSEVEAGSFMAGCRQRDGFALLVFVLLQFHCGVRVTPVAPGEQGLVDPRRVLDALRRSVFMTIDPSVRAWDYEADFAEPLSMLRQRYRIGASRFAEP